MSEATPLTPFLQIIKESIMPHNYQKWWVFTWNANDNDQLVDHENLENLLNEIAKEGVFQKERGKNTDRLHY